MIPELGHFALVMALVLASIQAVVPLTGSYRKIPQWMDVAKPAAHGQFLFLCIAFACLTYAFVVNDFSVLYVASNSNLTLPIQYRVSAVWGAHEGSLLLWALVLGAWTFAVTIFSRSMPSEFTARVLAVMGLISVGFLLFMLLTSNPFERIFPAPVDGRDLNPLLQDPGLVIHPPMLYIGYVGFSVAFAFAIAALLGGHLDAAWARWSRPWVTMAWVFLTLGITLGSWWAYHELGWGGWWFWDPVENASFMPWLVGTALIHSLAMTEKRGAFKNWTVLLAILAFSLSLLGTFLVRSGVLVSVHAFATDPERGIFILAFLVIVIGGSLLLYAWRAPRISSGGTFRLVSREMFLLVNNVLLLVACASILIGTLYPLFLDALSLPKISVGSPYFALVFVPLMLPLVFMIGVGPTARWKSASVSELVRRLWFILLIAVMAGIALPIMIWGHTGIMVAVGSVLALWAILTALRSWWAAVRLKLTHQSLGRALSSIPAGQYGMTLAHMAIGIFIFGVTFATAFEEEKQIRMHAGDSVEMAGYQFTFDRVDEVQGPNYDSLMGRVSVTRNGEPVAILYPEKRIYQVQTSPMTEAGIDSGLFRDIYTALGEPLDGGGWGVRLYYKPFVQWIWLGGLLMAIGGMLAAFDERYRRVATLAANRQREPGDTRSGKSLLADTPA